MTYSESAKGKIISSERAYLEIIKHGADFQEFLRDMGRHKTYRASKVLEWLGY